MPRPGAHSRHVSGGACWCGCGCPEGPRGPGTGRPWNTAQVRRLPGHQGRSVLDLWHRYRAQRQPDLVPVPEARAALVAGPRRSPIARVTVSLILQTGTLPRAKEDSDLVSGSRVDWAALLTPAAGLRGHHPPQGPAGVPAAHCSALVSPRHLTRARRGQPATRSHAGSSSLPPQATWEPWTARCSPSGARDVCPSGGDSGQQLGVTWRPAWQEGGRPLRRGLAWVGPGPSQGLAQG